MVAMATNTFVLIVILVQLLLPQAHARDGDGAWNLSSYLPSKMELFMLDHLMKFDGITQEELVDILASHERELLGPCFLDLNYTVSNFKKTLWGLQMFDASAKIPWGVLQGSLIWMGQFDECVAVEVPSAPSGYFRGQHCMADINVTLSLPGMNMHLPFFYGLCVPSTCQALDVTLVLKAIFKNMTIPAIIGVEPENCRLNTIPEPPAGVWVAIAAFFCFVLVGIASTVYDVYQRFKLHNDKPHQLWSSFSFYTNGKYLLSTEQNDGMITALFGIRTITMGWVVLGHAYLNSVYSPIINLNAVAEMNHDHTKVIIFNSFLSVDTFFLLSGMLACFIFFRSIFKNKTFDQPMGYLHRFLRLTPPYAAVILFEVTLFNYMGNGPFWHRIHDVSTRNCQKWWWSSLLYVQNYVNPLEICLTQSWYLSADMQMYWLSPLVLYPMYLFPALAVPYLGLLLLAFSFTDFAVVYIYDLPANFALNPSNNRMIMDYYPFHTRMAPWLVGVALGYLIGGIKAKKIKLKLTAFQTTCGWILSTVLMTASMQAMDYFNQNPDYTALEVAFFLAFHRVGWAIGLAWIILACADNFGGVVNKILSFPLFQPLAKLSFCAYLLHISVQRFRIGWLRTQVALEDVDVVWKFIGDFVVANLVSIIFFLLFEQPFTHIDRYFLSGVKIFPWPRPRAPRIKPVEVHVDNGKESEDLTKRTSALKKLEEVLETVSTEQLQDQETKILDQEKHNGESHT